MRPVNRRLLRLSFCLLIAGFFFWLALRRLDVRQVGIAISHVGWPAVMLSLLFVASAYWIRVIRWWVMVRACNSKVPLSACVWPLLVGFSVNNLAPLRIGDAVRILSFQEKLRTPVAQLFGTLVLERLLDLTVLLCFLLAGIAALRTADLPAASVHLAVVAVSFGLIGWILLLLTARHFEKLLLRLCELRLLVSRSWNGRAAQLVMQLFSALAIVRGPVTATKLLCLSFGVWICEGAVFVAIADSLTPQAGWFGPWFALATGTLSTLIPGPPGYIGTFEFFTMSGLMAYGVSPNLSAATALVVHAVLWLFPVVVGLSYFLRPSTRSLLRSRAT